MICRTQRCARVTRRGLNENLIDFIHLQERLIHYTVKSDTARDTQFATARFLMRGPHQFHRRIIQLTLREMSKIEMLLGIGIVRQVTPTDFLN